MPVRPSPMPKAREKYCGRKAPRPAVAKLITATAITRCQNEGLAARQRNTAFSAGALVFTAALASDMPRGGSRRVRKAIPASTIPGTPSRMKVVRHDRYCAR